MEPQPGLNSSDEYEEYFKTIEFQLRALYNIAHEARSKGLDPNPQPEPKLSKDLAERVEFLVGPKGIAERIRELSSTMSREALALKVSEDIIYKGYGRLSPEKIADQSLRTALAIITEGVTVAPVQGISKVSIKTNTDGSKYLAVYFAGPIRPAGGTEQAFTVVIADFIRKKLGLDRWKPSEEEVFRLIEEIRTYERFIRPFQYQVPDSVLEKIIRNLPVEVTGVETDPVEVTSYRDLPRVETNRVRGGALIVLNDGLAGRARKLLKIIESLGIEDWKWIGNVWNSNQNGGSVETIETMYLEEILAGRPVFGFPSKFGGFRVRYGRARNTGFAALGIHPATMVIVDSFLAVGTQIKTEKPGKAGIVASVDSIEPPIVKLKDGSVVRVETIEEALNVKDKIDKILFLGDILISFYEFLENKANLLPPGFTEELWSQMLLNSLREKYGLDYEKFSIASKISVNRLKAFIEDPFYTKPSPTEALTISRLLGIPIHPRFIYAWENLTFKELKQLRRTLSEAEIEYVNGIIKRLRLKNDQIIKDILERLLLPHRVAGGWIIIEDDGYVLYECLKPNTMIDIDSLNIDNIFNVISTISGVEVKPKFISFIGARMGRPEKANRRLMKTSVHSLFPIGLAGGFRRNIVEAAEKDFVEVELVHRKCSTCGFETYRPICPRCGGKTTVQYGCPACGRPLSVDAVCPSCKTPSSAYRKMRIALKNELYNSLRSLDSPKLETIKGVIKLMNATRTPEPLEKGILRAKYDLTVFKDGTIRFDMTNAPLTHFKPSEINTPIPKLKELGYYRDFNDKPLESPDQICELKIHDIILPKSCGKYLVKVANFIDELLEKFYRLPTFYNVKNENDLIGHLVIGLAPHTSVGVVGRIIGFTDANVCFAHPYWHACKRRDCDGDEDSIMLALDSLINFSVEYLPAQVGGLMDAPLMITYRINPLEVDSAVHSLDVSDKYPMDFYSMCFKEVDAREAKDLIEIVEKRLSSNIQFKGFKYTHPTATIAGGNLKTSYKKLKTMNQKMLSQLTLADKILAVDAAKIAEKILTTHLLKDITGNLRAFTSQTFRCKVCNTKYRRVPLSGKCRRCGGKLILTVFKGGIEKYLKMAENIIEKYKLGNYYHQRLMLIKDEISTLLVNGKTGAQESLSKFIHDSEIRST
ncbi:MAG: DNA polymerase II large subunit [Candidatus Bathyarchaeia archaeon]